ncbi:hypothetical protein TWF696_008819 [Orbilia brochopaga]|uniref:Uncharacterized protein n=1 Tax=Orbilia brochopaga TaxID=3140254 RepID=A0AAV9UKW0_9PEZI
MGRKKTPRENADKRNNRCKDDERLHWKTLKDANNANEAEEEVVVVVVVGGDGWRWWVLTSGGGLEMECKGRSTAQEHSDAVNSVASDISSYEMLCYGK